MLRRAYLFFEAGNAEEQLNINRLMKHLADTPDVIEFLCTTDPELSIPPYARMFNRHPPKDQTLLLSPEALNERYGSTWKLWVSYLERACPELTEGLDTLAPMHERKSPAGCGLHGGPFLAARVGSVGKGCTVQYPFTGLRQQQ